MARFVDIDDERLWDILFNEACVEGSQAERIEKELEKIISKREEKIMMLIEDYADKHELAKECGGEYIGQSDSAQIDAIELVCDIFDLFAND